MPKLRIHIDTIKNQDEVQRLIDSMYVPQWIDYEITISNNGDIGDFDFLKDKYHIFDNGNIGVSAARNQGISLALKDSTCKYFMLVPNDAILEIPTIQRALEYSKFKGVNTVVSFKYQENNGKHINSSIYPIEVLRKVGLFDEDYKMCWYEDTDYYLRMKQCGIELVLCKDARMTNFIGGNRKYVNQIELLEARIYNGNLFLKKWGSTFSKKRYDIEVEKIEKVIKLLNRKKSKIK